MLFFVGFVQIVFVGSLNPSVGDVRSATSQSTLPVAILCFSAEWPMKRTPEPSFAAAGVPSKLLHSTSQDFDTLSRCLVLGFFVGGLVLCSTLLFIIYKVEQAQLKREGSPCVAFGTQKKHSLARLRVLLKSWETSVCERKKGKAFLVSPQFQMYATIVKVWFNLFHVRSAMKFTGSKQHRSQASRNLF